MNPLQRLIILCVRAYQTGLSPLLGQRCRYHPTCSAYTAEAVTQHGALHGLRLAASRLTRCHPWADGGHDPVPTAPTQTTTYRSIEPMPHD